MTKENKKEMKLMYRYTCIYGKIRCKYATSISIDRHEGGRGVKELGWRLGWRALPVVNTYMLMFSKSL